MGKAEVRDDNRGERIKNLFRNGILQLSIPKSAPKQLPKTTAIAIE